LFLFYGVVFCCKILARKFMKRSQLVCVVVAVCGTLAVQSGRAQQSWNGSGLTPASVILNPLQPFAPPAAPLGSAADSQFGSSASPASGFPASVLSQIPGRVSGRSGQPGDVINLLILGDKHDVTQVLRKAGWSRVSRYKLFTAWHDAAAMLRVKAYRGVSMSTLYLFGRPQDISYARGEHFINIGGRHHFRIWRSPFQVDGQTLWVAAATHDVGLRFADHHLRLIHRIDPNVDAERQYISGTLSRTGRVQVLGYVTPLDSPTQAQTTTGDEFHTDGRALVLRVVARDRTKAAAATDLP
jgi:LssY C-terminus